jgi:hypothetical protein
MQILRSLANVAAVLIQTLPGSTGCRLTAAPGADYNTAAAAAVAASGLGIAVKTVERAEGPAQAEGKLVSETASGQQQVLCSQHSPLHLQWRQTVVRVWCMARFAFEDAHQQT